MTTAVRRRPPDPPEEHIDRLPPQNIEAEESVLGSIMVDQGVIADVMDELDKDGSDFYRQSHGRIFAAACRLYERGVPADIVLLTEELERAGDLEAVGGAGYLSGLGREGTSLYAVQYAKVIARKAVLRRMIQAAGRIAAIGYEGGDRLAEEIERAYLELRTATAGAVKDRTAFAKAGFRAYSLTDAAKTWRLVLSRVEIGHRDPEGLVTVYCDSIPDTYADLGSYALCRSVGLFGGTKLGALAKELAARIGEKPEVWTKRLDYLIQRAVREAQAARAGLSVTGMPERPNGNQWLFYGRMREARTLSLFGPGSAGKSTIADGLALSACTGREIIPGWRPSRRVNVGVLDWDEGEEEFRARLYAMCSAYGLELNGWHYRPMAQSLPDAADEVGKWIVANSIGFLIVTPMRRAMRTTPGDPAGPVNEVFDVLREFGTSNMLIDHVVGSAIDGQREATRAYGSGAKHDDSRGTYSCYAQSEGVGVRVVVLKNPKPDAMLARKAPQAIRIEYVPEDADESGTYDSIRFAPDEVIEKTPEREASSTRLRKETQPAKLVRAIKESGPLTALELSARFGFDAKRVRFIAQDARLQGYGNVRATSDNRYSLVDGDELPI